MGKWQSATCCTLTVTKTTAPHLLLKTKGSWQTKSTLGSGNGPAPFLEIQCIFKRHSLQATHITTLVLLVTTWPSHTRQTLYQLLSHAYLIITRPRFSLTNIFSGEALVFLLKHSVNATSVLFSPPTYKYSINVT